MDTADLLVLSAQLAASWAMVGLIWFVQIVHYPLFAMVGAEGFADYEQAHRWRTSFVVGPPMAIELLAAAALVLDPPVGLGRTLPLVGLVVLGVVHVSTVALAVPAHDRLSSGFDPAVLRRLVGANWVRTAGWSVRGVLSLVMLAAVAR
jgi:hypothetical protein